MFTRCKAAFKQAAKRGLKRALRPIQRGVDYLMRNSAHDVRRSAEGGEDLLLALEELTRESVRLHARLSDLEESLGERLDRLEGDLRASRSTQLNAA